MSLPSKDLHPLMRTISTDVLESLGDAFITVDGDFRFTYVNAACEQNSGRTRESLLGRNLWEEFSHLVGTPFETLYRRVMADRAKASMESYYPTRNAWYEASAYPLSAGGLAIHVKDTSE